MGTNRCSNLFDRGGVEGEEAWWVVVLYVLVAFSCCCRLLLLFTLHRFGLAFHSSRLSVHVSDTAGIREGTDDPIELEGIRRAWMAREEANVSIYLIDASNVGSNQTWSVEGREKSKKSL